MRDLHWSATEKEVARRAFNAALEREFALTIEKVKQRANSIQKPEDLWKLERYLTRKRKEIDEKYDYRYSVLLNVFARLICDGFLSEGELAGLGEDKMNHLRAWVMFSESRR